jgi:hypothetical protein
MLLDRQLETGGWNYNNIGSLRSAVVADARSAAWQLTPWQEARESVRKSLFYLRREMSRLKRLSFRWGPWPRVPGVKDRIQQEALLQLEEPVCNPTSFEWDCVKRNERTAWREKRKMSHTGFTENQRRILSYDKKTVLIFTLKGWKDERKEQA